MNPLAVLQSVSLGPQFALPKFISVVQRGTWPLILRAERRLPFCEYEVPRKLSGHNWEEI